MDRDCFITAYREGGCAMDPSHELMVHALIKARRRYTRFRRESELIPWLKALLHLAVIERLRRQSSVSASDDDKPAHDPVADRATEPAFGCTTVSCSRPSPAPRARAGAGAGAGASAGLLRRGPDARLAGPPSSVPQAPLDGKHLTPRPNGGARIEYEVLP